MVRVGNEGIEKGQEGGVDVHILFCFTHSSG